MVTVVMPELVVPCSVAVMTMRVPLVNALGATVRVTVALPLASLVADEAERIPTPNVVVKVTVAPLFAVPSAFLTLAVMIDEPPAVVLMMGWEAVTLTGDPKITVTVLLTLPAEAVTVELPAVLLVRVTVAIPPLVAALEADRVPFVAVKETAVPSATAVLSAFFTVAVMVTLPPTTGEVEDAVTVMDAGALGSVRGKKSTPQPAITKENITRSQETLCMGPPPTRIDYALGYQVLSIASVVR
jgi:hypothetical protein